MDEDLPQVNIAYFLDRNTGIPIYYDVYYGSIVDMNHFKTAIDKIQSVNKSLNAYFVMDRGYFSSSNLEHLTNNKFHFVFLGKDNNKLN